MSQVAAKTKRPRPKRARAVDRKTYAPGARILVRDEEWLVRQCMPSGSGATAIRCIGLSELVANKEAIFLDDLEDDIRELRPEETELVVDDSPRFRRSRLYLESLLRQTPATDERIYLGHRAAMQFAAYQLVPAAKALAQPRPRILIGDAVGLGKTIEVGILLSELIRRGRGRRILVVTLKSILAQFQEELWTRFTIPLVRLDSVGISRVRTRIPSNSNPFFYYDRVIISIDTLKKDDKYRELLKSCRWDAIVIDECQHVAERSTHSSGGASDRARLAQLLAQTCDALIMTSATPHDGNPESFASLIRLLEPTAIADSTSFTRTDIQDLFVRRFHKDVIQANKEAFRERELKAEHVRPSPPEDAVFEALAKAEFRTIAPREVHSGAPTAPGKNGSRGALFQTLLLKSFLSSPAALASTLDESLKRRRLRPENIEQDPAAQADRALLETLRDLVATVEPDHFTKLARLVELLRTWDITSISADNRVVIFTERIATLDLLEAELQRRLDLSSETIAKFHGSLDDQEQQEMVREFGRKRSRVRILLCSDAASEGVNLHFHCHRLVNFDTPWSLITLSQRAGRIDRYGQTRTPEIVYLLSTPTSPELRGDLRVLDRLIEKEAVAHKNLGDAAALLKLYDVEAEEQRVAEGISHHDSAEDIIPEEDGGDFLATLLAEVEDGPVSSIEQPSVDLAEFPSLFVDDREFAFEAFDQILDDDRHRKVPTEQRVKVPERQDHLKGFIWEPSPDLRRRYAYLPPELQREARDELKLTADPAVVMQALEGARKSDDGWPEWEFLWPLHPVMEWLGDRVLMSFRRHQAPAIIVSTGIPADGFAFLFQGILSNHRSEPMLVDWFAIRFPDQSVVGLDELRKAGALGPDLNNKGVPDLKAVESARSKAVGLARAHMAERRAQRGRKFVATLKDQERRLRAWETRALEQVEHAEGRLAKQGKVRVDLARRLVDRKEAIDRTVQERKTWLNEGFSTHAEAFLRIAAVLVGPQLVKAAKKPKQSSKGKAAKRSTRKGTRS